VFSCKTARVGTFGNACLSKIQNHFCFLPIILAVPVDFKQLTQFHSGADLPIQG